MLGINPRDFFRLVRWNALRLICFLLLSILLMAAMYLSLLEPGRPNLLVIFFLSLSALLMTIAMNIEWKHHKPALTLSAHKAELAKDINGEVSSNIVEIVVKNTTPVPMRVMKDSHLKFSLNGKAHDIPFIAKKSHLDGDYSGAEHDIVVPPGSVLKIETAVSRKLNWPFECKHCSLATMTTKIELIDRDKLYLMHLSNKLFVEVSSI